MIRFKEDPNLQAMLERELGEAMEEAGLAAALGLQKRLSYRSGKRTGRKYAKYPRRSSAWGEYPQEQSGELRSSVTVVNDSRLRVFVGFDAQRDGEKLRYLEDPTFGAKGIRRPLFMFFEGKDSERTLKEMARAIKKKMGSR